MDNEIERIYAKLDHIDNELIELRTSMAKAGEQIRKLEYSEAQHHTEISNTRHLLAECSSSIEYITRQLSEFSEQRSALSGATNEARGASGKIATFELLLHEKIKNISLSVDRVKESLEFSVEKVKIAQAADLKDIAQMKDEIKRAWRALLASLFAGALWVIRQFGTAKGWW